MDHSNGISVKISFEDEFPRIDRGEIYIATNRNTMKSYVGQAVSELSRGSTWGTVNRWKRHVRDAIDKVFTCRLLEQSIAKHGPDAWDVNVIEYCKVDQLNELEIKWIEHHNTLAPNGYNLMTGGGGGRKHNEESRKKMSMSQTGRTHSDETKAKMSVSQTGHEVREETRKKLSDAMKKRILTDKHKEHILLANKARTGTKLSDVIKDKMTETQIQRREKEAAAGIKPKNAKKVEIDGKIYQSLRDAANVLGVTPATIRNRTDHLTAFQEYKWVTDKKAVDGKAESSCSNGKH